MSVLKKKFGVVYPMSDYPNAIVDTQTRLINNIKYCRSLEQLLEEPPADDVNLPATIRVTSQADQQRFKHFIAGLSCSCSRLYILHQSFSAHPNIETIDLSHSVFLTDDLVYFLVKKCPKIKSLRLWNCISLHDAGFSILFFPFSNSFTTIFLLLSARSHLFTS